MWERYNISAQQCLSQGKVTEAENYFRLALKEVESATKDPKLPTTLNNLANCLRQQGRYQEAEPLYKQAIAIKEKSAGHLSKDLVILLENYAKLLRLSGRTAEADRVEQRAQAIFGKS